MLAFAAALIAWLAERHDAGEPLPVHDHARIAENRWRAMRHGLGGTLLDLDSGEPQPARERVRALIDAVAPAAARLGGSARARARPHARRTQRRRAPARARRRARDAPGSWSGSRTRSRHKGQRRRSDFGRLAVCRMRPNRGGFAGVTLAEEPLPTARGLPAAARLLRRGRRRRRRGPPCAQGAMRALAGHDLEELAVDVERHGADEGVVFHSSDGDEVFVIDPVPRVHRRPREWARVEAGLAQRVRALNAFVADVYGERRIVEEGVVPARVIEGAEYFEPGHAGRAAARRPVDRRRGARPRARRRGALPGARGQRPHAQRLRLRGRRAARAEREPRRAPGRPPAHARRAAAMLVGDAARGLARAAARARAVAAHRRRGQLRLLRARVGGPGARHPAARAGGARPRRGRRRLPPHERRPARHRRRRAAARADPRGPDRGRQRVRHRRRRRQAHARLRRGHDSLLRG